MIQYIQVIFTERAIGGRSGDVNNQIKQTNKQIIIVNPKENGNCRHRPLASLYHNQIILLDSVTPSTNPPSYYVL